MTERIVSWLVRTVIKYLVTPFLSAIEKEWRPLGAVPNDDIRELGKRLELMSREKLELLLNEKLAEQVVALRAEVDLLEKKVEHTRQMLGKLHDADLVLSAEVKAIAKMVLSLNRSDRSVLQDVGLEEVKFHGK